MPTSANPSANDSQPLPISTNLVIITRRAFILILTRPYANLSQPLPISTNLVIITRRALILISTRARQGIGGSEPASSFYVKKKNEKNGIQPSVVGLASY